MTIEQAWFVLEHGSAEGLKVYLEAIKTIKKNCVDIVRCEDCKHQNWVNAETGCIVCKFGRGTNAPDWFCADGERQ